MKLGPVDMMFVVQLFVLIDPVGAVPFLVAADRQRMNVPRMAAAATLMAFAIAVVITLVGPYLFRAFGITLDSLRVAGGIVLLLLGIETIRQKGASKEHVSEADTLISLMASPTLTGPATISFISVKTYDLGRTAVLANILVAFILIGIVFVAGSYMIRRINQRIIGIATRVLGLFLTAVAIEMMAQGLNGLLRQ